MRDALSAAAWLNLVMVLLGLSILAVPAIAPAIADDLGVSVTLLGAYSALMWTGSFVTSVGAGAMINRLGALRVLQVCLALAALGLAIGGSGGLAWFALAAVLIGMGQGSETPASTSLLVRVAPPERRTLVISLKQTGGQIGGILAGLTFPALVIAVGWRGALFAMVPLLLLTALMLEVPRRSLEPSIVRRDRARHVTFAQALRLIRGHPRLSRLAACCLLYVAVQIAQQAFLVSYLVAECALSLAAAGSMLALAQAGGLIGRVFWGAMPAHRISAFAALIVIGSGITLCALLLGALGDTLPLAILATLCFLFGATSAGWVGVHIAEVARLAPQDAVGPVTAAILVIGLPGLILGPLAFSALAAATSFGFGFCAFALLSLAGVAALATARREAPAQA